MKKRIIALVLAVVMCMLALVGCGEYDYSKAKLDKFTSVDVAAFKSALKSLSIEDGEFTTDPEERNRQTVDMIYRSLANSDNLDRTERTVGKYDGIDLLYYCYYVTAKIGDKDVLFDFDFSYVDRSTDKEATATSSMLPVVKSGNKYLPYVQNGLYDNEEDVFAKAILDAMKDKNIEDYLYESDTSADTEVKEGDFVLVSFTYTHTDEAGNKTTKTVTDLPMYVPVKNTAYTVPAAVAEQELREFEAFAAKLAGVKVAAKQKSLYKNPENTAQDGDGAAVETVEYTDVTVSGVIKGTALELEVTKYTEDSKTVKFKDVFGTEHDLTNTALTYHVFPAYYIDVEYDALSVLTVFYGSNISTDALPIFGSEEYKVTDKNEENEDVEYTLKALIEDFAKKQKTYETAKTAYDKAKTVLESAKTALDAARAEFERFEALLAEDEGKWDTEKADTAAKKAALEAAQAKLDAATARKEAAESGTDAAELEAATEAYNTAVTELEAAEKAYSDAVTAENNAKAKYEQTEKQLDNEETPKGAKQKLEEAEEVYKKAYKELYGKEPEAQTASEEEDKGAEQDYKDALAARDKVVERIGRVTSDKDGAKPIEEAIKAEFYDFVFRTNEDQYFEQINENLIKAVAAVIKEHVKVDESKLPRKAVNEVYDKLYEQYKYNFFTSAASTTGTSDYDTFGGDFKLYLMSKTATTSYKDAKKALKNEARSYVAVIMRIYKAAEVLELVYTDEEFKAEHDKSEYDRKYRENYEMLVQQYASYGLAAYVPDMNTKQDIRVAEQFEKLFDGLMACQKDADGRAVADENNIFKYTLIGYSIKGSED